MQVWKCPECKKKLKGTVTQHKTLVMCPNCRTKFIAKDK